MMTVVQVLLLMSIQLVTLSVAGKQTIVTPESTVHCQFLKSLALHGSEFQAFARRCGRILFPGIVVEEMTWKPTGCSVAAYCGVEDGKVIPKRNLTEAVKMLRKQSPNKAILLKMEVKLNKDCNAKGFETKHLEHVLSMVKQVGGTGILLSYSNIKNLDLLLQVLLIAKNKINWPDMKIDLDIGMDSILPKTFLDNYDKSISFYNYVCKNPNSMEERAPLCPLDNDKGFSLAFVISHLPKVDPKKIVITFIPSLTVMRTKEVPDKKKTFQFDGNSIILPPQICPENKHINPKHWDLNRKNYVEGILTLHSEKGFLEDVYSIMQKFKMMKSKNLGGLGLLLMWPGYDTKKKDLDKMCRGINLHIIRIIDAFIRGDQERSDHFGGIVQDLVFDTGFIKGLTKKTYEKFLSSET